MKKKLWSRLLIALLLLVSFAAFAVFSEPGGIPVLNYHQINNDEENLLTVPTEEFERQMAYLKERGYRSITAAELADALEGKRALPARSVLITFDDGYADNYLNAFPILQKYEMKAIVFLITDYVGRYPNYLTWAQVAHMAAGGIEFGSHTLDHSVLTKLPPCEASRQARDARLALEWRLGRPAAFLAYPCGYTDEGVKALVRDAGYRAAFTVDLGNTYPGDDLYALRRVPIFGAMPNPLFRFAARLQCPRLAARLESLQRALLKDGHNRLAALLPAF